MIAKKDMSGICETLTYIRIQTENIIEVYLQDYADYGWDSFTETLANVTAQLYMQEIIAKNATVKKDSYR